LAVIGHDPVHERFFEAGDVLAPLIEACELEMVARRPHDRIEVSRASTASTNSAQLALSLDRAEHQTSTQLVACLRDLFGIDVELPTDGDGSIRSLERAPVRIVDVAAAYAALANGGESVQATPVIRVEGRDGDVVYRAPLASGRRVLGSETVNQVTRALGQQSLRVNLPGTVATRMATSSSSNWIVGYTSDVVLVARVARDESRPVPFAVNSEGHPGVASIWIDHVRRGLATR
jgi:membrane peptidoglycan carboxypeptidase